MGKLSEHRTIADFDGPFELLEMPGLPGEQVHWQLVSYSEDTGQGSYLMTMAPGTRCNPHEHVGAEEFFVVEGDLVDCDGTHYRAGQFISLTGGSRHYSVSPSGCKLVVFQAGPLRDIDRSRLPEDTL